MGAGEGEEIGTGMIKGKVSVMNKRISEVKRNVLYFFVKKNQSSLNSNLLFLLFLMIIKFLSSYCLKISVQNFVGSCFCVQRRCFRSESS